MEGAVLGLGWAGRLATVLDGDGQEGTEACPDGQALWRPIPVTPGSVGDLGVGLAAHQEGPPRGAPAALEPGPGARQARPVRCFLLGLTCPHGLLSSLGKASESPWFQHREVLPEPWAPARLDGAGSARCEPVLWPGGRDGTQPQPVARRWAVCVGGRAGAGVYHVWGVRGVHACVVRVWGSAGVRARPGSFPLCGPMSLCTCGGDPLCGAAPPPHSQEPRASRGLCPPFASQAPLSCPHCHPQRSVSTSGWALLG